MATPMATIIGKNKKRKIDSVSIRKASNGYTVQCWDGNEDISMIAESLYEAMDCVKEMFGDKGKEEEKE